MPSSVDSRDCTLAPVWISAPFFFRESFRLCPSSLSMFAIREGSASRIVTFVPSVCQIPANSTPITPPPMISREENGSLSQESSSSLVIMPGRSCPGIGGIEGTLPDASRICLVLMVTGSASSEVICTSLIASAWETPVSITVPSP